MRHWQFGLAIVWACLGLVAVFRHSLLTEEQLATFPIRDWSMALVISVVFATWNLVRWWHAMNLRRNVPRLPLQPNPDHSPGYEYHPELDFLKNPTTPSAAGSNDPPPANPDTSSQS